MKCYTKNAEAIVLYFGEQNAPIRNTTPLLLSITEAVKAAAPEKKELIKVCSKT